MYYKTGFFIGVCVIIVFLVGFSKETHNIASSLEEGDKEALHQSMNETEETVSLLQQKTPVLDMKSVSQPMIGSLNREGPPSVQDNERHNDKATNDAPMSIEESIQLEIDNTRKITDNLDDIIQKEPIENDWAYQVEDRLAQFVDTFEKTKTKLNDVMCRSTLCRLEVEHSDLFQNRQFIEELKKEQLFPWTEMLFFPTEYTKNHLTSIVYFSREGYRINARM